MVLPPPASIIPGTVPSERLVSLELRHLQLSAAGTPQDVLSELGRLYFSWLGGIGTSDPCNPLVKLQSSRYPACIQNQVESEVNHFTNLSSAKEWPTTR